MKIFLQLGLFLLQQALFIIRTRLTSQILSENMGRYD